MLAGMSTERDCSTYHSDTKDDHKNKRTYTDHNNHNGPLWNGKIILGQLHIRV